VTQFNGNVENNIISQFFSYIFSHSWKLIQGFFRGSFGPALKVEKEMCRIAKTNQKANGTPQHRPQK